MGPDAGKRRRKSGNREARPHPGDLLKQLAEAKQQIAALNESLSLYKSIADFAYDWIYWRAPDGRIPYVSPSCQRVTGYRSEDFSRDSGSSHQYRPPGRRCSSAIPPGGIAARG